MSHSPLRTDALRTPDAAFANLEGYPWQPHYVHDLPALAGLRLHYLDERAAKSIAAPKTPLTSPLTSPLTYLCLHGNPAWSYLYRKMIPVFLAAGHRVVAPDMIGFGKSDKPLAETAHSFTWHRQVLLELVERLDLQRVVLVVQDWGGLIGLTLPMYAPDRYYGLLVMNTTLATGDVPLSDGFIGWRAMCAKNPSFDIARLFARGNPHMSAKECAAYMAPYPTDDYRAGTRVFPPMVPSHQGADGASLSRLARVFWQDQWAGKTFMAIGTQDPVLGSPVMTQLAGMIRHCPAPLLLEEGGHFVQEHGERIAAAAVVAFE